MAQHMIDGDLWTKSGRFRSCTPLQRYLFLFLLSNNEVKLCGIYEILLDDIAHLTGLDYRQVELFFDELSEKGLAAFHPEGWVCVPRYVRKANTNNQYVRKGIENSLALIPAHIVEWAKREHSYRSPEDTYRSPEETSDLAGGKEREGQDGSGTDQARTDQKRFDIPEGIGSSRCRSCRAPIYWIITEAGKKMPVDPDGLSHFASCPQSNEWRKDKEAVSE